MPRAILLVLDSVGCGRRGRRRPLWRCGRGYARPSRLGLRRGPWRPERFARRAFARAQSRCLGSRSRRRGVQRSLAPGLSRPPRPGALWGYAVERAHGKDTPSGHWEISGAPAVSPWGYFPETEPCFPPKLTQALIAQGGLPGILGNCHAPGIKIIERLGAGHVRTGAPICYTSTDSVFQIAAHETIFGRERLYDLCRIARRICDPLNIGRVIARPFEGNPSEGFFRTPYRKDFALFPPPGNLLDRLAGAGRAIVSIGKTGDIFGHRFTGEEIKRDGNMAHFAATLDALQRLSGGGMIFANFVDFDTDFGHRRDIVGYAHCLETFDARLPALFAAMRLGDVAVITADHGNDPTWRGTDHTREHMPVLLFGPGIAGGPIGRRESLADIGASLAAHLGLPAMEAGRSFLPGAV